MKNFVLSAALLGALSMAGAQAETRIDTEDFSIVNGWADDYFWNNEVVSNENGLVTIAMNGLSPGGIAGGSYRTESTFAENLLKFSVRDGYQITSMTFSGIFTGTSSINTGGGVSRQGTFLEAWVGYAEGSGSLSWILYQPGSGMLRLPGGGFAGDGTHLISNTYSQPLTGAFDLEMKTHAAAYGDYTVISYFEDGAIGSYEVDNGASAEISNVMLSVQVSQISAVPEPSIYALLLSGLGILGFTARKRKAS